MSVLADDNGSNKTEAGPPPIPHLLMMVDTSRIAVAHQTSDAASGCKGGNAPEVKQQQLELRALIMKTVRGSDEDETGTRNLFLFILLKNNEFLSFEMSFIFICLVETFISSLF